MNEVWVTTSQLDRLRTNGSIVVEDPDGKSLRIKVS